MSLYRTQGGVTYHKDSFKDKTAADLFPIYEDKRTDEEKETSRKKSEERNNTMMYRGLVGFVVAILAFLAIAIPWGLKEDVKDANGKVIRQKVSAKKVGIAVLAALFGFGLGVTIRMMSEKVKN